MNEISDGREIEREHLSGRDVVTGAAHVAQLADVGGPAAHTAAQAVGIADAAKIAVDVAEGKEVRALDAATAAASVTMTAGVGGPAAQTAAQTVAAVGALDAGDRAINTAEDALGDAKEKASDAGNKPADAVDDRFVADLDARMAKSELEELGWRDRDDLDDVMRDLELLAGKNWQKAAELWDKYRPEDQDKPIFIDGDDKDPDPKQVKKSEADKDAEPEAVKQDATGNDRGSKESAGNDKEDKEFVTPETLRKRYIETENKFYFRDEENKLAFEDKGKRLATEHNDPEIARSMVELAAAKNWSSIKVKGADEFKREVWLEASLRGMQVQGFKPTDVDLAKLQELRQERGAKDLNTIEQGSRERERQSGRQDAGSKTPAEVNDKSAIVDEQQRTLSPKQQVAIDALKAILRERGDSEKAIDMATKVAAERFQNNRVYVGRVVEHGAAPYENDPKNEKSYYVKLETASGEKTVWGVDLQRAVGEGKAEKGDDVAIAYQGKQQVTVPVKERDADGKLTGKQVEMVVDRNTWDVSKLDKVREEARERLTEAARNTDRQQPVVNIYDRNAARNVEREVVIREPSKDRQPEHAGRG